MSKSLDNPINWSFGVGSLFGIRLRVHFLFVLGGLVVIAQALARSEGAAGLGYGLGSLAMLFSIVLLHEFGHCFGARYVGGSADEILMWPLGGLASTNPPHNPRAHLITVLAGPAVNVVLLLITGAVLVTWTGTFASLPFNPFRPFETGLAIIAGGTLYWLVTFFTLNLFILLFNLAPVYPFDGGRILQCLLWRRKGFGPATLIATGVGMGGAIAIGVIGIFTEAMMLFAIAFFGYLTCWQQRQALKAGMYESENEFGYDFSGGYTSLNREDHAEKSKPSFLERRRAEKADRLALLETQRAEQRQKDLDRILDKVHTGGMQSLTPQERHTLEEETERKRARG